MADILTQKEKDEIEKLRGGYHIVKKETTQIIDMSNKVDTARTWIPKLLKYSFYLNIISIICFLFSFVSVLMKPSPEIYISTPNGMVYKMNQFENPNNINQGVKK